MVWNIETNWRLTDFRWFSCWHLLLRKIVGVEGDHCMTGSICLLHFLEDSASVRGWDTSTWPTRNRPSQFFGKPLCSTPCAQFLLQKCLKLIIMLQPQCLLPAAYLQLKKKSIFKLMLLQLGGNIKWSNGGMTRQALGPRPQSALRNTKWLKSNFISFASGGVFFSCQLMIFLCQKSIPKNLKNTFQKTREEVCLDVNAKHTDSLIPCFPSDIVV